MNGSRCSFISNKTVCGREMYVIRILRLLRAEILCCQLNKYDCIFD
jgi:hypothetical protein